MGCLFSRATECIAPTLPDHASLVSGKNYYLYNVGNGKFLTYNENNTLCIGETGIKVTITANENGTYSIKFPNYYLAISNSLLQLTDVTYDWNISSAGNGTYSIQNSSGGSTEYMGCKNNNDSAYCNCTTADNVEWKLIDGDAGDLYYARLKLYNVIQTASKYCIDKYEAVYDNPSSTIDEINDATTKLNAAFSLTSSCDDFPNWNDYPILLEASSDNGWHYDSYMHRLECNIRNNTSTLTATIYVDEDATLTYISGLGRDYQLDVLVDGIKKSTFLKFDGGQFFVELSAGKHTIQWSASVGNTELNLVINHIGIKKTPLISVNLLNAGSLGTEILYNVDNIKQVRRLKIKGKMNADDWNTLLLMRDSLYSLDLGETDVTSIASEGFRYYQFLHSVVLPERVTSIGSCAFLASGLDSINFPSSLRSIGDNAFDGTHITTAMLPDSCTNIGTSAFSSCFTLVCARLPKSLKAIPNSLFDYCVSLKTFALPDSITSIGIRAFFNDSQFGKNQKLNIPNSVSSIGSYAFCGTSFTSAELPVSMYKNGYAVNFYLPNTLTSLRLNSPTVMEHIFYNTYDYRYEDTKIVEDESRAHITLIVPSYLVNAYKLDGYWYNFEAIEGFDTKEISSWKINRDLILGARDRFNGIPSIEIGENVVFMINGTDGMDMKDFSYTVNPTGSLYSRIMVYADNVKVNGDLWSNINTYANRWYFISLPYDIKVGDITGYDSSSKYAVRYYDGNSRAINGATGNWKNLTATDTIPAGSGFIFQVNKESQWKFLSMNNVSKQYLTSNKMFVKALAANKSNDAANSGWNLIGNPYQCWYNLHKLNFTAPITVYENNTYAAYSVIDDDYAIAPNQAFFVQCPEGINEVSFPLDGCQMTSTIETQSGAKPNTSFAPTNNSRELIDLTVSNGTNSDRTRIVLNNEASISYETSCDAAKFLSDVANVPQIYSYDSAGNKYAINERPEDNGIVKLAFVAKESGCFTFSLSRNSAEKVLLVDNENSQTIDLTKQDYSFTADAGTYDNRFELRTSGNNSSTTDINSATIEPTSDVKAVIGGITVSATNGSVIIFTLDGKMMSKHIVNDTQNFIALPSGKYVVNVNGKSTKVVVF